MFIKRCYNVPEAFVEMLWVLKVFGREEESRNGPIVSIPEPIGLTIERPVQRVLIDPVRDANPFFHVMEFVWMMAGSRDIQWIAQFNKNMLSFSDDGIVQNAAYGHRWRSYFKMDQISLVISMLKADPTTRRAVLGMWDPEWDLGSGSVDIPCNTQIMLRVNKGRLESTVTNRSNDVIWGMMGANAVHMTFLHELISLAAGLEIGSYHVFSNNVHIYKSVPNYRYYMDGVIEPKDVYTAPIAQVPLLQSNETYEQFVKDCENFVAGTDQYSIQTFWMKSVAQPIFNAWKIRKAGGDPSPYLGEIAADDWRIACGQWVDRRVK